jgi:hypothetical protein
MKVKFLNPDISTLPHILKLGYSPRVDFGMQVDREYVVYAISMWKFVLHYLVIPDNTSLPFWYPADIFNVTEPRIPSTWYFAHPFGGHGSEVVFELGYEEIVQNQQHSDDLVEREPEAIRVFLARKAEIEKSLSD